MRVLRSAMVIFVLLGLAGLLAFGLLCFQIDRYGRRDMAQPADAIVVLGALVLPDGQPGPDLSARTQHAVALYHGGLASHLICGGGAKDEPKSAAATCKALAMSLDVAQDAIWLADGSANTDQEAQQVATVMAEHGWQTAILVSHPLHVYRAKLFFERQGLRVYTSPTTTDVEGIALPWRAYYTTREGVGILWPYLEKAGFPPAWTASLHKWVYAGLQP